VNAYKGISQLVSLLERTNIFERYLAFNIQEVYKGSISDVILTGLNETEKKIV
jgi:hypothetical protein